MKALLRFLATSRRGAAVVEFALLGPILLLMLLGLIDVSRMIAEDARLSHAARAGAQYGIQSNVHAADLAAIEQAARDDAGDGTRELTVAADRICTCPGGASVACNGVCGAGDKPIIYVRVRVQREFETTMPYPVISSPVMLASEARLRLQ